MRIIVKGLSQTEITAFQRTLFVCFVASTISGRVAVSPNEILNPLPLLLNALAITILLHESEL